MAHVELHAEHTVPLMNWPTGQFEGAQVLLVVSEYPVTQDTHTVEDVQVAHGLVQALQVLLVVSAKNPAKQADRHCVPVLLTNLKVLPTQVKQLSAV